MLSKILRPVLHDLHGYTGPLPPETNAREIPPLYRHLFSPSLETYRYGSIIRQLKPLPYYNTQLFKRPPNGDMPFCFRDKSVKENLYAADLLTQMQMKLIHPENNKQYRQYAEQFAEFLKSKRIQLIGVVPPATPFYRDTLPQSLKTEFYDNLRDIFLSHGFPLLDFYDSPEFNDTDYVDYAHLNDQGARKLTKLVSKYLPK